MANYDRFPPPRFAEIWRSHRRPQVGDHAHVTMRGARVERIVIDEAQSVPEVSRRQMGDEWDETKHGVRLPPIAIGTLVEVYDVQRDWTVLAQVTDRLRQDDGSTLYEVVTEDATIRTDRTYLAVVDLSTPEGVERFLEQDGELPRTAEEAAVFFGEDPDA